MVVASEVLPLPSEAPGWRLPCSSLGIGEALGSSVERPVPGCAVLGNADAEPGCVVSCDADAEAIQGGFTDGGGSCKASRNLVLAPSSSCEKATWKAFRAHFVTPPW